VTRFDELSALGVQVAADAKIDSMVVTALAAVGLTMPLLQKLVVHHPVGCACANCDPQAARTPFRVDRELWLDLVRRWAPRGRPSIAMGSHHYHLSVSPVDADRAQMALAEAGDHLERQVLVDGLYDELTEANPELATIPTRDPRARHWVVVGALSGLGPAEIRDFVSG
jgi:hypothetical protein